MPPPAHPHQYQQHHHPNPSILSTFTTALADLSTLNPALNALRHDYLALELELRDLMLENSRSCSLAQELQRKNEVLEKERDRMQDECAAAFAGGLKAQNDRFAEALKRGSGGSGDRNSGRSSGGDWRDGVLGEVWLRKGRFVWVRREGGVYYWQD